MDVVSAIRGGIGGLGKIAVAAGEGAVIAKFPFLGLPILKQIWEMIAEEFAKGAIGAFENGASNILIPIIDKAQAEAANAAKVKLQADLENEKTKSEELARDLAEFKKKYAELIHMRRADP